MLSSICLEITTFTRHQQRLSWRLSNLVGWKPPFSVYLNCSVHVWPPQISASASKVTTLRCFINQFIIYISTERQTERQSCSTRQLDVQYKKKWNHKRDRHTENAPHLLITVLFPEIKLQKPENSVKLDFTVAAYVVAFCMRRKRSCRCASIASSVEQRRIVVVESALCRIFPAGSGYCETSHDFTVLWRCSLLVSFRVAAAKLCIAEWYR